MDVNYLLHRQQVSLIRAQHANTPEGRAAHLGLAKEYRQRIDAYRIGNREAAIH